MPLSDPKLWNLIRTWPLPSHTVQGGAVRPDHRYDFAAMLCGSTGLTKESAERVTEIYRKFLYLRAISPRPLTPSTTIDAAWHMHLDYVEDYMALCRATGRELRHYNKLTHVELDEGYLDGLALYEAEFDAPADDDLWPAAAAIADRKARETVRAIVFFTLFLFLVGAVNSESPLLWAAFGAALCLGTGTYVWAGWRWPRQATPEHDRTSG